uniref:D1-type CMS protein ORF182 n=1 Tax=Oryza sativa TaxID=4530 RepID=A0A2U9Q368_ORYSA|nr:D1-type CMS protein ORF182 [Oryza sativa]
MMRFSSTDKKDRRNMLFAAIPSIWKFMDNIFFGGPGMTMHRLPLFVVKRLADTCVPGGAFLIALLCSLSSTAMAAGPSDWMRGDPNETLLRQTDKQIEKVNEELRNVTSQAVEKAQQFQLNLPGTSEEQTHTIRSILEHDLDGIALNQRLRRIRRWVNSGEIENPESLFWLQIIDQFSKWFP